MSRLALERERSLERFLALLSEREFCPYCAGSLLSSLNRRVSSWILGHAVLALEAQAGGQRGERAARGLSGSCSLCGGEVPSRLPGLISDLLRELREYEFESFKAGAVLPPHVHEAHDEVRAGVGIWTAESPKVTLARMADDVVAASTGARIDPSRPDVVAVLDLWRGEVRLTVNPVYLAGRYLKLSRGISQARWICPRCGGRGCEECGWTGYLYPDSVEALIGEVAKRAFEAEDYHIHAAGREDVDARMLGTGRPFVLELVSPRRRRVDLWELQEEVNRSAEGKVAVVNLRYAEPGLIRVLKEGSPGTRKVYRAVVEVEGGVSDEELRRLEVELEGATIEQRTPTRVLRRRADLLRRKMVHRLATRRLGEGTFEMIVECDGGLYVKELVSGDEGRTRPSVASVLGKKAFCRELDVLAVLTQEA